MMPNFGHDVLRFCAPYTSIFKLEPILLQVNFRVTEFLKGIQKHKASFLSGFPSSSRLLRLFLCLHPFPVKMIL